MTSDQCTLPVGSKGEYLNTYQLEFHYRQFLLIHNHLKWKIDDRACKHEFTAG
jgi:hypothetical protein